MHDGYNVMYMVRNLLVGDDEQTRIDNDSYWEEMPAEWQQLRKTLIDADMYDEACILWLKYHTEGASKEELEAEASNFLKEWNSEEGLENGNEEWAIEDLVNTLETIKYSTYFSG